MARRKRARVEKVVIITGEQREDIDAAAIARVLIRLARSWAEQQQDTESAEPEDGRKDHS